MQEKVALLCQNPELCESGRKVMLLYVLDKGITKTGLTELLKVT